MKFFVLLPKLYFLIHFLLFDELPSVVRSYSDDVVPKPKVRVIQGKGWRSNHPHFLAQVPFFDEMQHEKTFTVCGGTSRFFVLGEWMVVSTPRE